MAVKQSAYVTNNRNLISKQANYKNIKAKHLETLTQPMSETYSEKLQTIAINATFENIRQLY